MVRNEDFDNLTLNGDNVATGTDLASKADQDGGGTAELQNYAAVKTEQLNANRVWDSSGRYHGELTGTNDAQVVIDAISDRTAGASVCIPDPGFDLDWDQQVDLPVERGFGLYTTGMPQIVPSSDFADEYALYKPAGQSRDLYIGPIRVEDTNGVLTEAAHLTDIRGAMIDRLKVFNAGGIRILSEDIYANQNVLMQCETRLPGDWDAARNPGPGVVLDSGSQGNTTDQNWVFAPHYNASEDYTTDDTAYIDRGKHNNWLYTRFEFGDTIHQMEGGHNYYISEGGWDRPGEYSVREIGNPSGQSPTGQIDNIYSTNYDLLRILHPNTTVSMTGDTDTGARASPPVVDLLEDVRKLTTARTLNSCGLQDDSTGGGEVSHFRTFSYKPFLEWDTGGSSGDEARLTLGPYAIKAISLPKAAYSFAPAGSGSMTGVVARTGLYGGPDNRFELVYDPGNDLGGHSTDNWYVEVVDDGTQIDSIDTGVAPHTDGQDLAFNIHVGNTNKFCAAVDYNDFEIQHSVSGFPAQMTWHWAIRTTEAANKSWRMADERGMRFYKY